MNMLQELRETQVQQGAVLAEGMPVSFGGASIAAKDSRGLLYDRSHWGKILVKDNDRLKFLHNQSSNNWQILQPGQGCEAVFLTSTARTIDLATGYVLADAVFLIVSANRHQHLLSFLDKYIFFSDHVQLQDIQTDYAVFSLIGEPTTGVLASLGIKLDPSLAPNSHQAFPWEGGEIRVAIGSGLASPGYTLIITAAQAASLWQKLYSAGLMPIGNQQWEQLRIQEGRPAPDAELTEDYNPLEAGLWAMVSFNKGCYIGQETIARLDTYKGVKQQLWGLRLDGPARVGDNLLLGEEKVGKLTSYTETEQGHLGLGYVRTKAGGAGLRLQVGSSRAEVIPVPFLQYGRS